jgi:hypothetical protein
MRQYQRKIQIRHVLVGSFRLEVEFFLKKITHLPARTIPTEDAQAMRSHARMKGGAVARIVVLRPKYSMQGPPAIPPARPARGIIPPTHEA